MMGVSTVVDPPLAPVSSEAFRRPTDRLTDRGRRTARAPGPPWRARREAGRTVAAQKAEVESVDKKRLEEAPPK